MALGLRAFAEKDVLSPLAAVAVPPRLRVVHLVAVVFPFPLGLDDFVRGTAGNRAALDGNGIEAGKTRDRIRRHRCRSPGIPVLLRGVTVAVFAEAVLRSVVGVALVGREAQVTSAET